MSVNEQQLELLDVYLDGELPEPEASELQQQLRLSPELAAALESLKADRIDRAGFFASLEPDETECALLVRRVRDAVLRDRFRSHRARVFHYVTAAAACLALGFMVGWALRDNRVASAQPGAMVSAPGAGPSVISGTTFAGSGPGGRVVPGVSGSRGQFQVTLYDRLGRPVAVQRFNTLQEARQFTEDLAQWQRAHQQMRNPEPVLRAQF
jgi:anti-sigma factor RsiW